MSSRSTPNLSLGWSDTASPIASEKSSKTWASSAQIQAPVFPAVSDWQKARSGSPSRLGQTTASPTRELIAMTGMPKEPLSTSELHFKAAMEWRELERGTSMDETERLIKWDTAAKQVDIEQSKVRHEQWSMLREQIATITGEAIVMHSELKEIRRSADQEQTERRSAIEAVQVALRSSEDRIFGILEEKLEEIRLLIEALAKTLSKDYTSLLEKSMSQAEALTHSLNQDLRNLLAEESTARSSHDVELDEKFVQLRPVLEEVASKADLNVLKKELVRLAADLEREVATRAEGDKHTMNQQLLERTLERMADLNKQLEQEVKTRVAGDEQMRDFLKDALVEAGRELEAKILQMARSMLEDKTKIYAKGDEEVIKKLQEGLETVVCERTELARTIESTHEKLKAQISTVESGVSSNHNNVKACVADLTAQVDSLTSTVQARVAVEEKLLQSCRAHERLQVQLSEVESRASDMKAIVADLIAKVESQTYSVHVDSAHRVSMEEKLEQLCKAHEKLKIQISEVDSGGSSNHSSIEAIVEDLSAKVETLTSTVKADSALRLAVEEKLEQSCKALRADSEQALDKVRVGLKLELTEFSGKKDAQDKAMKEAHGALLRELRDHKQSTEKERLSYQKDIQDHKVQLEEEKRARDAAHRNLDTELKNRDRVHKGLDGKMDDVEKRLKSMLSQLSAKQQTHADSMNSTERRLRDEIVKMNQGAAARQIEVERKLREEFTSVHSTLGKRIADLSQGLDGKQGSLREMVKKVSKDVEALSSSVQEEVRLRTAAEDRLSSRCDGLRAELTEVAKEQQAALRKELSQQSSKSKELETLMRSANETLRKEFSDHRTSVQSENDSLKSQLQRNSSPSPSTFRSGAEGSGLISEGSVQQTMQSHTELINSQLNHFKAGILTTLRNDLEDLGKQLHREMERMCDVDQGLQEGLKAVRDSIDTVNIQHHTQHKETRILIVEQVRSVLQDADGKVGVALHALTREVEDHRENLKTYLTSQRGWDSETLLTSAVQRLEDDMQQFQTLSDEVKELKLDQALAQANLDRRLQDLDYLSSSLEQLQADHDTLRRTMSWEDEMRRVWEAIDTHTHSMGYEDFKERVRTQVVREVTPVRDVTAVREVTPVREVPHTQTRVVQSPFQRLEVAGGSIVVSPPSVKTIAPAPKTKQMGSAAMTPDTPITRALSMGSSVQTSPTMSPMKSAASPAGRMSPPQSPPHQLRGIPQFVKPTAGERADLSTPVLRTRSTPSLQGAQIPSVLGRQGSLKTVHSVEVAPGVSSQMAMRTDMTAIYERAVHDIRPGDSSSSATITTTTEERSYQHGKFHQVGKAMFELSSDLDPATRHND